MGIPWGGPGVDCLSRYGHYPPPQPLFSCHILHKECGLRDYSATSSITYTEQKLNPPVAPLHPWIHINYAGPFLNQMFLIVIDEHSKWPEVIQMLSITTSKTVEALHVLFAKYGLSEQLVSDNGPQFTSEGFSQFMRMNGIKHICSAPYHPSSNGLAERFVQTFKWATKAGQINEPLLTLGMHACQGLQ